MTHVHAFSWLGPRADLDRERERRADHPSFTAVGTPPMRVADWLRKPVAYVKATFDDPPSAVSWLSGQAAGAGTPVWPPLDRRCQDALDVLGWGGDIAWGLYGPGVRYLSLALVSCPNRADPQAPCPCAASAVG
ncbi:hypothetical protein [Streptomyces avicenniae]|uniref:hypothetical protein n=1 Tax=Streptomyces avicenniae TaxID=500153 RepID=UPI00069974F1|nr:hypothetical protein [Streptomyces avicenniae]